MAYIDTKDVKAIREALKAEFGKDFKFSVTREHFSSVRLWEHNATKKYRKNLSKTLPKRGPNPVRFDAKNVSFFNIDFFGFGARFWSLLGLQLGAMLTILASKLCGVAPCEPS